MKTASITTSIGLASLIGATAMLASCGILEPEEVGWVTVQQYDVVANQVKYATFLVDTSETSVARIRLRVAAHASFERLELLWGTLRIQPTCRSSSFPEARHAFLGARSGDTITLTVDDGHLNDQRAIPLRLIAGGTERGRFFGGYYNGTWVSGAMTGSSSGFITLDGNVYMDLREMPAVLLHGTVTGRAELEAIAHPACHPSLSYRMVTDPSSPLQPAAPAELRGLIIDSTFNAHSFVSARTWNVVLRRVEF